MITTRGVAILTMAIGASLVCAAMEGALPGIPLLETGGFLAGTGIGWLLVEVAYGS